MPGIYRLLQRGPRYGLLRQRWTYSGVTARRHWHHAIGSDRAPARPFLPRNAERIDLRPSARGGTPDSLPWTHGSGVPRRGIWTRARARELSDRGRPHRTGIVSDYSGGCLAIHEGSAHSQRCDRAGADPRCITSMIGFSGQPMPPQSAGPGCRNAVESLSLAIVDRSRRRRRSACDHPVTGKYLVESQWRPHSARRSIN